MPKTHPYATTNARLIECLGLMEDLISWAYADAEHATENDAHVTAADDRWRAKRLEHAHELVKQCEREE